MELDAALASGPLSAEEVMHLRMKEQQAKQREADQVREEADRLRDETEKAVRERLRLEIARECASAIRRLAEAGYPGGGLMPIITRYEPARHWYGRRYHVCYTSERACWGLHIRNYATDNTYLASDGKLYMQSKSPQGYRGKNGYSWTGLHEADLSGLESWKLSALLDSLKRLPES